MSRPDTTSKHPLLPLAHVVVPQAQAQEYREKAPSALEVVAHPDTVLGIAPKRQWILENLFEASEDFVFMSDDDVAGASFLMTRHWKLETRPDHLRSIIEGTARVAMDAGIGVFGYAHNINPRDRTSYNPFHLRGWVSGAAMGILDRDLVYDTRITGKDDVQISLESIAKHRFLIQDLRYHWQAAHWNLPGGLTKRRTSATEEADMRFLADRFGSDIVQWNRGKRATGLSLRLTLQ